MKLTFPYQLGVIQEKILQQEETLKIVAGLYADAIEHGGLIHVYANGHSRVAVEELCVRMGALSGFRAILSTGLTTFTDVVGSNGLRLNQFFEKVEKSGAELLDEIDFGPHDVMLVVTATGTTAAAVDMALEFTQRYPSLPLVAISCAEQSKNAPVKHSSGMNLWHIIEKTERGFFIDNGMPVGDLSTDVKSSTQQYRICPLSSVGALTVVQSLNELTLQLLVERGVEHFVLQNMHLNSTGENYEAWLRDQRRRYAKATYNEAALTPGKY
ncbi:putative phosphosugar-binding protein [Chitinophaga polysaccharea]|uniref:Putative phosphosugar-binding protein n=1 Tax=Chitinophaga polysaccharea TaxID=1293035 RepID=A0A561PQG6_9BACT|nr:SIS domain-containing protein [Chitinophaga polysaccharea]TWF40364.1 putative phosphosugar-binding protein [Chitinophaga polysaccharea]